MNELYFKWSNTDLCREVDCKANEVCVANKGVASCVKKAKKLTKSAAMITSDKQCDPCPVVRPDFVCGSDNR